MTARFFRFLACQLLLVFACASAQAADGIEITSPEIRATEDGYKLVNARYSFDLNPSLEQAIQKGVPFSFTTEIDMTRPRWWWTDDHAVSVRRTVKLQFDALTRVYRVSMKGSLSQDLDTLEEALAWVRRPPTPWVIAPKGALKPGETYNVTLRMYMDRDLMAKPLQVDALNNSDLRLTSPKKTFTYRAE